MKIQKILIFGLSFVCSLNSTASILDGNWTVIGTNTTLTVQEFDGDITFSRRAYYDNGAPSDYFFEFVLPAGQDLQPGQIWQGKIRSLDGLYHCAFEENAQIELNGHGQLLVHFPLLTFFRRTSSVSDDIGGGYERYLSWQGWEWVEIYYSFPYRNWQVISSECIVTQKNMITNVLERVPTLSSP